MHFKKAIGQLLCSILLLASCTPSTKVEETIEEVSYLKNCEKVFIQSDVLGEEREIWVYIPKGFYGMDETNLSYPVTYVLDAEGQFLSTVGALEQMSSPFTANDLVPQMVVVGIVNTNRNRDLTPTQAKLGRDESSKLNTGGAGKMARFMEKELIPFIEEKYPVTEHRSLVGHSLGGLFVLNALWKYPDLFQNYLSIDPFLSWDDQKFADALLEGLQEEKYSGKKLYIATGNNLMTWMNFEDVKTDTTEVMRPMRSNLEFSEAMEKVDVNFSYVNKYYSNENHFQIPLISTYEGFRYFFDFYHFEEMMDYYHSRKPKSELKDVLQEHYAEISKEMGYRVVPSESYINSWAFGFIEFEKEDIAEMLFDLNIQNYPESSNVYSAKGYGLLAQKDTSNAIPFFEQSLELNDVFHVRSTLESLQKD